MSANKLFRVVEGPVERDGTVVVPVGKWAVLSLARVPDPDDETTPFDPGTVVAVCGSEQEAERKARELIFGPAGVPDTPDVLDSFPEGEPEGGDWEMESLDDEEDEEDDIDD